MNHQTRVCVFVDGENLRHSIIGLFPNEFNPNAYLPKQAKWEDFYKHLATASAGENASLLRAYWYVIQHVDFSPYSLPKYGGDAEQGAKLMKILCKDDQHRKTLLGISTGRERLKKAAEIRQEVIRAEARFKKQFEGWQRIQDGICLQHSAIEFRRAGAIKYNTFERKLGREKAVDVKLATDLVLMRDIYDTAVIVSGDQDYVPAVQAIKDRGKRVVNVAFEKRNKGLLPGGARRLNQVTDDRIIVSYGDCQKFLRIGDSGLAANG